MKYVYFVSYNNNGTPFFGNIEILTVQKIDSFEMIDITKKIIDNKYNVDSIIVNIILLRTEE